MLQNIVSHYYSPNTPLPALIQLEEDLNCWENVYGVLRGQSLLCYQSEEDLESEDEPLLVIPVRKVGDNE